MWRLTLFLLLFTIKVQADWVGNTIELGSPIVQNSFKSEEREIIFEPNPLSEVTISFIGPQYAFGLKFTGENEDDGELFESSYSDFLISYYTPSYIVDIFYNRFEDFYVLADLEEMIAANKAETISGDVFGMQLIYFPQGDIFGLYGPRVLKPQTNYDFYLKFRFEHKTLIGSDTVIPSSYSSDFSKISNLEGYTNDTIEAGMGIAGVYAWDHFFINSYLMLGPSYEYYLLEEDENNTVNLVTPVGEGFAGLAYYSDGFQAGYRVQMRQKISQINGVQHKETFGSRYFYFLWIF